VATPIADDSLEPAGVTEALASLTPIESKIFRRSVLENASVAEVSVSTTKVVETSGFTSWIHMVVARQYVLMGAAFLLSGTALELTLSALKVNHSPLAILQVLLIVVGILLFFATIYRLSTARTAKRSFVEAGKHQAELGEQRSDSRAVITLGLCAAIGSLGLDEFVMGLCFATRKFEVTRLTGYFFMAMSLIWLGGCVGMIQKRRSARLMTAEKASE
jgi:hypothetical protein